MKVLFLTNLPSPYRVDFFCELGKLCDLTVIYERYAASDRDKNWVSKAKKKPYKEIFLSGKMIGADNSFCPEVINYISDDFDQIVVGMYSTFTAMTAMLYMKAKKISYIISTDGGFISKEKKLKKKVKSFFLCSAKAWLSTGKSATEYLEYYGAKTSKIYTYPFTSISESDIVTGVLALEQKKELRKSLGMVGERIIISVGSIIHRKGFDILVEAVEKTNFSCELYIIGGEKKQLENCLRKNIPEKVHVIDFMDKERLFRYYQAADLFVLATRCDVWGLVINEAMACGLPVISTDKCGAGIELVEIGENGYIVPCDNSDELADKIEKVFENSPAQMGEKSILKIKDYTFENMANVHMDVLKKSMESEKE